MLACVPGCLNDTCVLLSCRSKTHLFEEFLFAWQDRLRKLEQPTVMSVKLQGEVDKYKVAPRGILQRDTPVKLQVKL